MNRVRVTDRTRFLGRPPHRALRVLALIGLVVLSLLGCYRTGAWAASSGP